MKVGLVIADALVAAFAFMLAFYVRENAPPSTRLLDVGARRCDERWMSLFVNIFRNAGQGSRCRTVSNREPAASGRCRSARLPPVP